MNQRKRMKVVQGHDRAFYYEICWAWKEGFKLMTRPRCVYPSVYNKHFEHYIPYDGPDCGPLRID
jgi:hypothetical protein